LWVGNTDGQGVFLRRTPTLADRLSLAYPDGTPLVVIGDDVDGDGHHWHHVGAPDGREGYVPVAYAVAVPPAAVVTATSAPATPTTAAKPQGPTATLVPATATPSTRAAVELVSVRGGRPGQRAGVTIRTTPNTNCSINYVTPLGTASRAQGLIPTKADANGNASWTWLIGTNTRPGTGTIYVTCGGTTVTAPIEIG
jgi:hypothetical protein